MKKAKRNAVLGLILFAALVAGVVYMVLYGVGKEGTGRAEDIPLGLDLRGGVSVTYQVEDKNPSDEEISATRDKLQRRVDTYSPDGEVYMESGNRITVEIPLDTEKYDPNDVLDTLGRPGKLEFIDPDNYNLMTQGQEYEAALTGADVKNASAGTTEGTAGNTEYVVHLTFTDEGAKKFASVTGRLVGQRLYIFYDGVCVSAPNVREQINGGTAQIDGMEDYDEANELASTIKIGALPLTLSELSSQVVGARLGSDALNSALKAGAIGLAFIFLLMLIIFRFPGFIASIALSVYVLLELFFLNVLHITLTLPGIAGIILSIGMAVDANVIIFTRIKEELADGKTVKTSVQSGFKKALSAIIDGNITTIIAGVVLLAMGTGTVKGFARTLILGIVISMFTALVITKFLLNAFVNLGVTNKKLYGKAKAPKTGSYSKRFPVFAVLSILVILTGIAFLFVNKNLHGRGETLNYSLEFSGGTSVTATFNEAYTLDEVEKNIIPVYAEAAGVDASKIQVQIVDDSNQVIFKSTLLGDDKSAIQNALDENFGLSARLESNDISNTISSETRRDAVLAVVIASILMLIYIAFRFSDVRFGVSAVIALIHDVMFVFFAYAVAYLSVGGTFIACMLTIVGYSINSTIIIFDRIRENLKVMSPEIDGYDKIVNVSISQTFMRNIYTNLTTFATIFCLFLLGTASLREFTLALMVGVVCGTYSSICITGPLWLFLRKRFTKKEEGNTKNSGKKITAKAKKA